MHAGLVRPPRFAGLPLLDTVVVHDDRDASTLGGWRRVVQSRPEGPTPGRGFARAQAMHQWPGRALEGTGSSVRGRLARGPDELPHTCGAPGLVDCGPQMESECIRTPHHGSPLPVLAMKPATGQPFDPLGRHLLATSLARFQPQSSARRTRRLRSRSGSAPTRTVAVQARPGGRHTGPGAAPQAAGRAPPGGVRVRWCAASWGLLRLLVTGLLGNIHRPTGGPHGANLVWSGLARQRLVDRLRIKTSELFVADQDERQ